MFLELFCDPEFSKALFTVKHRAKKEAKKKNRRGRRLSSVFALPKQRSLVGKTGSFDLRALHDWKYERELFRKSTNATVVFLFLVHTPVSKKVFEFFNCDNLYGHSFMRADYTIECHSSATWLGFSPYVVVVGLGFTLGLPFAISVYLWKNRQRLQSPMIKEQIGFLYDSEEFVLWNVVLCCYCDVATLTTKTLSPFFSFSFQKQKFSAFNEGVEWWEVHEILRKSVLTGLIIYVQNPLLQTSTALVVSIIALINLNYFHPHRSKMIFMLDETAFVTTALMFHAALLLSVTKEDSGIEDNAGVGVFLIALNVFFFVSSIVCVYLSFREICKGVKSLSRVMSREMIVKKKKKETDSRGSSNGNSSGSSSSSACANENGENTASKTKRKGVHGPNSPGLHQVLPIPIYSNASTEIGVHKSASEVMSEHNYHERKLLERRKMRRKKSIARTKSRLQARNLLKGTKVLEMIPAFKGIDHLAREKIAQSLTIRNFDRGKVVCAENEEAQEMYILLKGRVRVTKKEGARWLLTGEETLLAEMQAPSYFGEIALLSETTPKRTASVTVDSDLALLMIMHREEFDEFLATNVLNAGTLDAMRSDIASRLKHTTAVLNHEEEAMMLGQSTMSDFDLSASAARDDESVNFGSFSMPNSGKSASKELADEEKILPESATDSGGATVAAEAEVEAPLSIADAYWLRRKAADEQREMKSQKNAGVSTSQDSPAKVTAAVAVSSGSAKKSGGDAMLEKPPPPPPPSKLARGKSTNDRSLFS
jgi:CRP-like cAMP-binding protein